MTIIVKRKNNESSLPFGFILEDWLCDDTISTAVWTVPAGLTQVSSEVNSTSMTIGNKTYEANTVATVVLSGGTDGVKYSLSCLVTTAAGYIEKFEMDIMIK